MLRQLMALRLSPLSQEADTVHDYQRQFQLPCERVMLAISSNEVTRILDSSIDGAE